ncbi:Pseudouridine synthase RluC/RluD protein [Dioscorea alata]|uniref:Pseudouridine synthase RluC/RluD protein n=4 Tax=Dioscorea alata TaxID=55571 RepID=A0ACB7W797_DIOAL|nr:Pseudouridine synthase RluC/RluD protein [Dioscorea alata]KAH7683264.1 Pseudouridine synthase RluC/RluD protein [Dioscorea alata]KAH7683265.1 Pseudouridine synthase RluC/RluD protein [Dioscorea alata]KAH7683266.1 Pseudouridine synthase RluC/RluD protein [Dioscorea alata]
MEIVWQTPANPPEARDYIIRDGKRFVRPYYFEFVSYVKNRWVGKTVVDLFTEEFTGRPREYYVGAVKSGRIKVDGQVVSLSYRVRSSQKISHFLHRHEPPVLAGSISILQEEPEVVTICKPASMPVHSCGQYRKNTVVGILQAEHGLTPLFPVHRLDRLVSGLLIFARNPSKADQLRQQIEAGLLHKEYIAKVLGVFPEGEQVVNANIDYNAREGRSSAETADKCNGNHLKGKTACTKFTRISTNGIHSIVLCEPVTGRTHQIRVHLQHIGHPIANDELYLHHSEVIAPRSTKRMRPESAAMDTSQPSPVLESSYDINSNEEFSIDPMCTNCPNLGPKGYDGDEEGLWLHCLRYSGPDWTYECPFPDWAFLS